jgi:thiamine transporter ThiT
MRALVVAIVRGLVKGLVIGLALGLVLTFALRWPVPVGSLLGYLAAMAACGTTGIAGGDAPWREGAW